MDEQVYISRVLHDALLVKSIEKKDKRVLAAQVRAMADVAYGRGDLSQNAYKSLLQKLSEQEGECHD